MVNGVALPAFSFWRGGGGSQKNVRLSFLSFLVGHAGGSGWGLTYVFFLCLALVFLFHFFLKVVAGLIRSMHPFGV